MVKKFFKWSMVILVMITLIVTFTIKAYADEEKKVSFASVSSNEVSKGSNVNITLNLKEINYSSYTIKLTSDSDIISPTATDKDTGNEVGTVKENTSSSNNQENTTSNEITNEVENNTSNNEKNNTDNTNSTNSINNTTNTDENDKNSSKEFTISNINNIDTLILTVSIPEDAQIGDKITLTIVVQDTTNSNNILSTQITLTVVDKTQESSNSLNNNIKDDTNMNSNSNNGQMSQNQTMGQTMTSTNNDKQTTSNVSSGTMSSSSGVTLSASSTSSTAQTITYDGSDDNYLTNLSINGEDLSNFNKTNTTYFKTLESGVTSADISYTQSDSSSTVCVYGNTSLQSGLNKILITVTAENGSVRYYRVYITVKS